MIAEPRSDDLSGFDRAFDAVDWHLCLYENGKVGYDQTIRDIIASVHTLTVTLDEVSDQ